MVVVLVDQQPLLFAARRATADEREVPGQLLTDQIEAQVAGGDGCQRIGVRVVGQLPRSPVPDDDVAAAVLAARDDSLEVEVLERMVLDVHRQPLCIGVERRALRDGPAEQHAGGLEPEVVVQAAGSMALHDETVAIGDGRRGASRFGCRAEVALLVVLRQALTDARARSLRRALGGHRPSLPTARVLANQAGHIESSSSHSASGMGSSISSAFSAVCSAVAIPATTATTGEYRSGNCRAAARNGTRCAAQMAAAACARPISSAEAGE